MPIEARTVFCDDIRREDNGKAILIGVYTDDLVASSLPMTLPLSLWIDIRGLQAGEHDLSVHLQLPAGAEITSPSGQIVVNDGQKPVTIMLSGIPANLQEAGFITVKLMISGQEVSAGRLEVLTAPSVAAT